MSNHPQVTHAQVPPPPFSTESEGKKEAIKINLSSLLHSDLDLYVEHTGQTKSDVISQSIRLFLTNDHSWQYKRFFVEPKVRGFDLSELNNTSQSSSVFLVATSHPSADYREYMSAQVVDSEGADEDDYITIKPVFYLPMLYGQELPIKSDVIFPQIFKSPNPQIIATDLRYKVKKKYVWSISHGLG